jgi:hypothetical protein
MAIALLTTEQHRNVVGRLVSRARQFDGLHYHEAGTEYTSLMVCFLLNNVGLAQTLLKLYDSFGAEWFPATAGYVIARSMFEVDVTAHYISLEPKERATRYIKFASVLEKRRLDAVEKHRQSPNMS